MPEGGGKVVEELLCDDVVPTGCSAGARRVVLFMNLECS
jgi:hypothetical protein